MAIGIGLGLLMNPGSGAEVIDFLADVDPRVPTTSANGTVFNSSGAIVAAATNSQRRDYNPATFAHRGLLIEGARTNIIRNGNGGGATAGVIGSGGALATNWGIVQNAGLTFEVISTFSEGGITFTRVRISGNTGGSGPYFPSIAPETSTQIVATPSQQWASSVWLRLVAGSFSNWTKSELIIQSNAAAGTFIANARSPNLTSSIGSSPSRVSFTSTLSSDVNTARTRPIFGGEIPSSTAVDVTFDIGFYQHEQGANASSYIPTTSAAVTRAVDVPRISDLARIGFNPAAGTVLVEFELSAVITGTTQRVFSLSNGTENNRITFAKESVGGNFQVYIEAGSAQMSSSAVAAATGQVYKAAIGYAENDCAWALGGTVRGTDASVTLPTMTQMDIGLSSANGNPMFGWLRKLTYYPRRLPNADLQSLTAA